MSLFKKFICLLFFIQLMNGCKKAMPPLPSDDSILDGPIEGLNSFETKQFLNGDIAFNDEIFTTKNGLGPLFVANSCGTCHAGDGKGHPFTTLIRFGQSDSNGNLMLSKGGPQLQNRAIPGHTPESLPNGVSYSKFLAPAVTGLGFIDAIPDSTILAFSDPFDSDGDGISGVPNWINIPKYSSIRKNAISSNGKYIGRFGKKGSTYDLLQQTVNAYNQDMGINSIFEPLDTYSNLEVDPEVSNNTIYDVVFYLKTLKAPIQRNISNPNILNGKKLFVQIGCENCHKSTNKTGFSTIHSLSFKNISPYTDLLLHDMGKALDDNYTEGSANTFEWKTPALWGLGLSKNSQGGNYFLMHDGRARTIEEAILYHDGEGYNSKINFTKLSNQEKNEIIRFLESL